MHAGTRARWIEFSHKALPAQANAGAIAIQSDQAAKPMNGKTAAGKAQGGRQKFRARWWFDSSLIQAEIDSDQMS